MPIDKSPPPPRYSTDGHHSQHTQCACAEETGTDMLAAILELIRTSDPFLKYHLKSFKDTLTLSS